MYEKSIEILTHYWKHQSFRAPQQEIITAVLNRKDTIALLPTGGGKSICFQIPALINDGVCIVISPLIALMQDQVDSLVNKGIKATIIPSGSSQDEIITLFDNIRFGKTKFLYISPERLQSRFIQEKIKQLAVNLIAIDEAHCISEWGHDFRPSYQNIAILKELQPKVPFIALTATATKKVVNDIIVSLKLDTPKIFKKSFYRKNLAYQIFQTDDKLRKLNQIFTKTKGSAIVYVNSRVKTKNIASYLNAKGFKSSFYHAGLTIQEKERAFDNWMTEKTPIIVATNAFGMGIDKPNVRVVIHLNLPGSIENYIQEAGRGGRDGNKAFSVILNNQNDLKKSTDLLEKSLPNIADIKLVHRKLYQQFQITKGELIETAFDFNFLEFCTKYKFTSSKTHAVLQLLNSNGIIELNANFQQKSSIHFIVSSKQVVLYWQQNPAAKNFIQTLLRLYGGVFENPVKIDEFYIAKKTGITSWQVVKELERMLEKNILEYQKASNNSELFFLQPREDDKTINRVSKNIELYLAQKKKKQQDLIHFLKNNDVCRSVQLLNYFNEETTNNCGICDVCLQHKQTFYINPKHIIALFDKDKKEGLTVCEICTRLHEKQANILILLRTLLSEEKISVTNNKYFLL
ncbi:ATP-dependent DNA helicase RecQ [Tenacibaculum finnmarkense]|uniref:RecQ family ATP-dependent DNA helicase n=1 Tax=Tenacibaculum finnmarkense TaxID=2781243 RepID=UPI000C5813F6|nr:ATP-dependent DNA helicase RecQ [Tenacibaculum finnmarkense]MBE7660253.1 RecQ family ATP-dependent DNA helicase [Tenacibaculum finnmarkense genomovar finnmarkense]MCG8251941.1 RecQ family ATP-dependent DNA helicase [Tenacibaculum finnmarkense genomovar finnmarkense]MCG8775182.1 RecQ family ATP-dependent DNA helicase [Tenacibaculum finnmarkense]MCG8815470.1 RecQ family ATP-dependent DNA helicase [Tenacibaculum finnmarkense]MCG8820494.1 RecQ family ATP-dependent DNA helicase [Tenacibaculum fi